jgi:hypothetical protein
VKIGLKHTNYLANKIVVELNKSGLVSFNKGLENVVEIAHDMIEYNIKNEKALEERTREIIEEKKDQVDDDFIDERELFKMVKKQLAPEYNFLLNYEDRFSDLAHTILGVMIDEESISFKVEKVRIQSIIFEAMLDYLESRFDIEDTVYKKLSKYNKKLYPGTDEYQIVFDKLYEEELRRSGGMA